MTHTFLLEVGLEEMPANVIVNTEKQLVEKTKEYLTNVNLSFGEVKSYSTPRRFSVQIEGLAEKQADESLTVRGPAKRIAQDDEGNWTKAAIGFSRGQGGSVEDLVIKDEKGEPYVFMEKFIPGKTAMEILQGLNEIIQKIEFPKQMKWGNSSYQYIRPIHWIVALLDDEIVPLNVFEVSSDRKTKGHRFLGKDMEIAHAKDYNTSLKEEFVIAEREERKAKIVGQIRSLCEENNWEVPALDTELLDEVTDLVEYPTASFGEFDADYLDIPETVLETSMIDHQRYFPVRKADGDKELLPYFIFVRNGDDNYIDNVARGNEKVLSARLADGRFFYLEDNKFEITAFVEQLKSIDYHEQLGTIYEKQVRVENMIEVISENFGLSDAEVKALVEITSMYKFDLVTQIVDEFPTLQGTIGGVYSSERGVAAEVSTAISEQYLPQGQGDSLPETSLGKYIALMDKLDTLIQFFSIGMIPTGSNDPHALRRMAIGVVRLVLSFEQNDLKLIELIEQLVEVSDIPEGRQENLNKNIDALVHFILDRLEQMMRTEYDIAHDVRQAVLGTTDKNLTQMIEVAKLLNGQNEKDNYKEVVESITRVLNMTKSNQADGEVNSELLESDSEKELAAGITELEKVFAVTNNAKERYAALEEISPLITEFFEHNMIMIDNEELKQNRLILLNKLAGFTSQFADFSQLVI